jgi:hypothetical protein
MYLNMLTTTLQAHLVQISVKLALLYLVMDLLDVHSEEWIKNLVRESSLAMVPTMSINHHLNRLIMPVNLPEQTTSTILDQVLLSSRLALSTCKTAKQLVEQVLPSRLTLTLAYHHQYLAA